MERFLFAFCFDHKFPTIVRSLAETVFATAREREREREMEQQILDIFIQQNTSPAKHLIRRYTIWLEGAEA